MLRLRQRREPRGHEAIAEILHVVAIDVMRHEIAGDEIALHVVRQVAAADDLEPAMTLAPDLRDGQRRHGRRIARPLQRRIGEHLVEAARPGAGDERSAPGVEVVTPGVVRQDRAVEELEFEAIGAELPDAATEVLSWAVRGLHGAANVQPLVEIQPALRPPAKRVDGVMRVVGAEAGEHDALLDAAVMLAKKQQTFPLADVDAAVARHHPGRNHEPRDDFPHLLRPPIRTKILEHDHVVVRWLPRQELRITGRAQHPEPAARVEVDLDWIDDVRLHRNELQFVVFRQRCDRDERRRVVVHVRRLRVDRRPTAEPCAGDQSREDDARQAAFRGCIAPRRTAGILRSSTAHRVFPCTGRTSMVRSRGTRSSAIVFSIAAISSS